MPNTLGAQGIRMLRQQFVLFQMDEARRLIDQDHLSALRVALLLLDNAAEVLLDRWAASALIWDGVDRRLQENARSWGAPEDDPALADLFAKTPPDHKKVRNISRYFDEKINYATVTKEKLPAPVGSALSHLHRYRNRAYHHADVNEQTLRTSVVILFELCCQLMLALKPGLLGFSSQEDFSWLEARFGVGPNALWDDRLVEDILDSLRGGLPISDAQLGETLAANLRIRIEEVLEQLDFMVDAARVAVTRSEVLASAQQYALESVQFEPPYESAPRGLDQPASLEDLDAVHASIPQVEESADCVSAVAAFAKPDTDLERIEFMVGTLAQAIDVMIQNHVDEALGK